MLIDLFTFDPALEAKILETYKGKFFPDIQHRIDKTEIDGPHLYCFYDLDPTLLFELLDDGYEYELKDSRTGKPIPNLAEFLKNLQHP
jgi:hypothetical protein